MWYFVRPIIFPMISHIGQIQKYLNTCQIWCCECSGIEYTKPGIAIRNPVRDLSTNLQFSDGSSLRYGWVCTACEPGRLCRLGDLAVENLVERDMPDKCKSTGTVEHIHSFEVDLLVYPQKLKNYLLLRVEVFTLAQYYCFEAKLAKLCYHGITYKTPGRTGAAPTGIVVDQNSQSE